jgi:hypothetical protein
MKHNTKGKTHYNMKTYRGVDVKIHVFLTLRDSNSNPSVSQPVASRYIDYAMYRFILTVLNITLLKIKLNKNIARQCFGPKSK